jgi:PAS domain S-box-containing protein
MLVLLLNMKDIDKLQQKLAYYEGREKELIQNQDRLRMAIEATDLGTWDYEPLTGALSWSEECKNIYGLAKGAAIDMDAFAAHIYPGDKEFVNRQIQNSMDPAGGGRYDITYRIIRFDDESVRWIRAQGKVYFNTNNQAERFIGTVLDITDSKEANERLARSEKLFRSIALNIPNSLIIVIGKDHRFITVEGDLMVKMGFDSKSYEGKHPNEVSAAGRYEATKHLYDRVLRGEKFSEERTGVTGDVFMVYFIPLADEGDEIYAGLIIAMDITEAKQSEEKNAKLAAIIDSSDDAIISKTLEGIITSWNESAQRIFGYTAEEMIGQHVLKLIPEDRHEEEPKILAQLRNGHRVEHFETKRITKHRQLLDISLTISPVRDKKGNIIGLSKIARDITEKKLEELRKNDFIAMISHELKTPLTSMLSYVQVLLAKAKRDGDSFAVNALTRSEIQAKKMSAMINDFLSLARLEDGKISLSKEQFDIGLLIKEIAGDAQLLTATHDIQIEDCGIATVYADRDKIGQVLMNLLSNAIKYSPNGGKIIIGCQKADSTITVYVEDDGIGISLEDQKELFNRFYRVKNEKIKTVSGFGIGLYLVSEILRYHNTKIEIESKEDVGSNFYFTLKQE